MYRLKLVNLDPARLEKIKWLLDTGIVNENVWLAGGALRTVIDPKDEIVDYDLFFKRQSKDIEGKEYNKVPEVRDKLIRLGFRCTFECPEGKLYTYQKEVCRTCPDGQVTMEICKSTLTTYKVQLVTEHFYNYPEELLATFDLTPSLFCTDGEFLWTTKKAIQSVKKKVAYLHKLTYPVSTFKRIMKYQKKGYSVLPAIQSYVSNLLESSSIQYTDESMRVYID